MLSDRKNFYKKAKNLSILRKYFKAKNANNNDEKLQFLPKLGNKNRRQNAQPTYAKKFEKFGTFSWLVSN